MMIINVLGLLLIGLIVYWFWIYREKEVKAAEGDIQILVENGTYQPSRIKVTANRPARLIFHRKDESPCAATVLIPKLDISRELPLDKTAVVDLPALESGEYEFHCQMQMYRGTLVVE